LLDDVGPDDNAAASHHLPVVAKDVMDRLPVRRLGRLCPWVVASAAFALTALIPDAPHEPLQGTVSPRSTSNGDDWFILQRSYPTGRTPPPDALGRAMLGARLSPETHPTFVLPNERWVPIGPQPIAVPSLNTTWSGRVSVIAPDPTDANTLYIGADAGGIWRTTDGGVTWSALTDAVPLPTIQSIAIDPVTPSSLYATTNPRTYAPRLLRSTDSGTTWQTSSVVTDDGVTMTAAPCSFTGCVRPASGRMFLDPRRAGSPNNSVLYISALSHVLRSDNSGATFHPVLSLPVDFDFTDASIPTNIETPVIRDGMLDPSRPDRLFVAVATPHCLDAGCAMATSNIAVLRSVDVGGHWERHDIATAGPYPTVPIRDGDIGGPSLPRMRLAIAPSNPDLMGLAFLDAAAGRPRLFLSADGGTAWSEIAMPVQGQLVWSLGFAFNPVNPTIMFVTNGNVSATTNGGQDWFTLPYTHGDNIVVAFTASRGIINANDGGVFRYLTFTSSASLNRTLSITECYSIAAHPSNALLMASGTQDNGVLHFTGSLGWSEFVGGDGADVVFDPAPQATVLYTSNEWYAFPNEANLFEFYRCQPSGGCLTRSMGIDKNVHAPFLPRIAMDPNNTSRLYLTTEYLYRTDDRADSRTAASPSVANYQRCWQDPTAGQMCAKASYFTAAAVAPTDSQTVYAGTLNGDVWLTTNRGTTWTSVAGPMAGPLPVRNVTEVVVDPLDSRVAYVAYSGFNSNGSGNGHLFRTIDGGQSWQDLTGNLPDVPVNTILIDPDSATSSSSMRVLYVGTDIGVFKSTLDGGRRWQTFGAGLPSIVVNRLAYNATTHQLLAATYGRGIWAISSRFAR
jgi:photosystem II stability/assembly factor-like uncharacterized protein